MHITVEKGLRSIFMVSQKFTVKKRPGLLKLQQNYKNTDRFI
jgi:hypothetical protein